MFSNEDMTANRNCIQIRWHLYFQERHSNKQLSVLKQESIC